MVVFFVKSKENTYPKGRAHLKFSMCVFKFSRTAMTLRQQILTQSSFMYRR